MELAREGGLPVVGPSWEEVEASLAAINPHEGRGFVSLTQGGRSYVQTAGAKLRAIVEYRQVNPDGAFRHCVLGKPGRPIEMTSINSSIGIIQLQFNEVLTLKDAAAIFRVFYQTGAVPSDFEQRDITSRFLE